MLRSTIFLSLEQYRFYFSQTLREHKVSGAGSAVALCKSMICPDDD
jgi:hypothetical protein